MTGGDFDARTAAAKCSGGTSFFSAHLRTPSEVMPIAWATERSPARRSGWFFRVDDLMAIKYN